MKEHIIIFGASLYGEIAYIVLKEKYDVLGFADNDTAKQGKLFCSLLIYSPEEVSKIKDVEIVIASQYHLDIGKQLKELGLINVKVFLYKGELVRSNAYKGEYKLVKYHMSNFFENVKVNENMIKMVQQDFRMNYENAETIKKNKFLKENRKKVLFCAYYFPPLGLGGTQRSLKFVKYLRLFGYEPIVITVANDAENYKKDYSMLKELPDDIEILRFDNDFMSLVDLSESEQQQIFNLYAGIGVSNEWLSQYLNIVKEGDVDYLKEVLLPDHYIYWVNNVLKTIEEKVNMSEIELVFTTLNPFSSNFIGYYIKQKYYIPWIIDYRDSWTTNEIQVQYRYEYTERIAKLLRSMEKIFVKSSDHIIAVTEAMQEEFAQKLEIDRKKIAVIQNGFDEEDFDRIEKKENKKFTLCYNGQIYAKDDRFNEENSYTIVLSAINKLIKEQNISKEKIQWIISGNIAENVKKTLKSMDVYDIVLFNGYLEHKESLKKVVNADMLVHFGFYCDMGKGVFGGGKVYEYLRAKKPILFLSKMSALDKLVEETKCGKNFAYTNIIGISEYVLEEYIKWSQKNSSINIDEKELFKYERKYLTGQLAKVFDMCLGENLDETKVIK